MRPIPSYHSALNMFHGIGLSQRIRRRDRDGARRRMLAYPTDAQWREKMEGWSTTPIHLACQNGAPVELIGRLIDANPEALVQQDRQGRTPFHLTILNVGGDEQTILLSIRRVVKQRRHYKVRGRGHLFTWPCLSNTSPLIFEALLQANIDMATTPSGENGV